MSAVISQTCRTLALFSEASNIKTKGDRFDKYAYLSGEWSILEKVGSFFCVCYT